MFNVVLVEPEIPQNTGNIGRTVLAVGAKLHLVKPIGFSLDDRFLKRAGLDYWKEIELTIWESFDEFMQSVPPDRIHLFSTRGARRYDKASYSPDDYLLFGRESRGIRPDILNKYEERTRYLPMQNLKVRSMNLSSSAAVVIFEALRQNNFGGGFGN